MRTETKVKKWIKVIHEEDDKVLLCIQGEKCAFIFSPNKHDLLSIQREINIALKKIL